MAKKHHAKITWITCYCSKCNEAYIYEPKEMSFDGWAQDHHGGSSMTFTCKGCNTLHFVTLSEY